MRTGVIGTGYWGPNLIRNLLALNQEVLIYDINPDKLNKASLLYPACKPVNSLTDILDDQLVEAVAIAVPLKEHSLLVTECLRAGKHVYVEKPLCYSTDEAESIKRHINGKILMIGHITLYSEGIVRLKNLLSKGTIGKLTGINFTRTHLGKIYPGADVVSEVAVHDIASLLFLLDERPQKLNAWGTSRALRDTADSAHIILGYNDGLKSVINVQWTSVKRERTVVAEGTKGTIVCETINGNEVLTLYDQREAFELLKDGANPPEAFNALKSREVTLNTTEPLFEEMKHFLECIENNQAPRTDFEFGSKVVYVAKSIRKSVRTFGKTEYLKW
jgi:UDP-2-acetamido-3-amino-2,3-dideoxy-glucuronate N-acetyltransferase